MQGTKQAERTIQMKLHFMELHEDGKTIKEIAAKYNITARSVYLHLQEIADENGVSRESLLDMVQKEHDVSKKHVRKKCEKVDPEELKKDFEGAIKHVNDIIEKIDIILKEEENGNAD